MARTPFFPESIAGDFRVILVFWEACWPPGWDPECPREPLYWSHSETCLRVTGGGKLQVMWKVSGMELYFPRALVSCHQEYKRQEQSRPLTRGAVCQSLTFHERPRDPSLPASSAFHPWVPAQSAVCCHSFLLWRHDRLTEMHQLCSQCVYHVQIKCMLTVYSYHNLKPTFTLMYTCVFVWMYLCMHGFIYLVLNGIELTFKVLI